MLNRRALLEACAGLLAATAHGVGRAATAASPERLPLEAFARRPAMESIELSPDGLYLAALVNSGSQTVLVTRRLSDGKLTPVMAADNLDSCFNWFRWINNERLVLSLRFPFERHINYTQTYGTTETRLLAVNADGSKAVNLVKSRYATGENRMAVRQDQVIDWLPDDGKHLLLALPDRDGWEVAVFKVNVYSGDRSHHFGTKRDVYSWITDRQHRVRVGMASLDEGKTGIWVCNPDGSNWRMLERFGPFAAKVLYPIGFGRDPHLLFGLIRHEGLLAVHELDLREDTPEPRLKLAHPRRDLEGSLVLGLEDEPIGVSGSALGDSSHFFWDERYKAWQTDIDEALPGRYNIVSGADKRMAQYILFSEEQSRPPRYYLGLRGEQPRLGELSACYPELDGRMLSRKQPISYAARDGLELRGYLSLPPGAEAGKALPMVVFPHGGPQDADGPEFDPWVAFMADRGYGVLQVNFRGSTGRGLGFIEAGLRRWGLEMQEDLEDGVAEMVKRGVADGARVAIVGASYGGYAALMGVVKTPRLYKGAFAFAPVSDLYEFVKDEGRYGMRDVIARQIGSSAADAERLKATSPRLQAHKIEVPLVLVHGTHDRSVEYRHSVMMAEAMKAAGKPCHFISQDRGDHGLSYLPYRLQLFKALEDFLARVLA